METVVFKDGGVATAAKQLVMISVDVGKGGKIVEDVMPVYGSDVQGIPAFKFLKPDGTVMDDLTSTGSCSAPEFVKMLEAAVSKAKGK